MVVVGWGCKSVGSESLGLLPLWFECRAWFISDKANILLADLSGIFSPEYFFFINHAHRLDQLKIIEIILKMRKFQMQNILKYFVRPDIMGPCI